MKRLNNRNELIDIIKGGAIFLVIFGHSIQYSKGLSYLQGDFFENIIFKIIYSFHMPLFMLVSGYLFSYSIEKYDFKTIILKKFKSLIVPIIVLSIMKIAILLLIRGDITIKNYIGAFLSSLWFLWAVFYCSMIVLFNRKLFKDNKIIYAIVLMIFIITPNYFNKDLYGFMYVYFIIGYFVSNKYKIINKKLEGKYFMILITYSIMMLFWNKGSYIYTTGITIYNSNNISYILFNDIYRYITGLLGAILTIKAMSIYQSKLKFLINFGKRSMGIYIISGYLFQYILSKINIFNNINLSVYTLLCLIIAIIILIITYYLTIMIEKHRILSKLILGLN